MTAIYIPPCTCDGDDMHLPACPHFDPAWDAAPILDVAVWTARPWGCECGAGLHEGETHEEALLAEAVEASTSCTCGGYVVDGELLHDGFCDAGDEPGPVYQLTEIGHGRIVLRELGLMPRRVS